MHDPDSVDWLLELMARADDAFNNRDLETLEALHMSDVICHAPSSLVPTRSMREHRDAIEHVFAAFPDVRVENRPYPVQFGQGQFITVLSTLTGTFRGELAAADGASIAPTGKPFEVAFSATARWQRGRIAEEWVFWDTARLAAEIGLTPTAAT